MRGGRKGGREGTQKGTRSIGETSFGDFFRGKRRYAEGRQVRERTTWGGDKGPDDTPIAATLSGRFEWTARDPKG